MNKVFFYKEYDSKKNTDSHIIFICDHATNIIEKNYKNLGLKNKIIKTHIAWDIGAKKISLLLAKNLKQSCFFSNFSRLLIDPNRSKKSGDLIVKRSFEQLIPGNLKITQQERSHRIKNYYDVYHDGLSKFIKKKNDNYKNIYLISIHSFTKTSNNFDRAIEIGLLWNKEVELFLKIRNSLLKKKINVGNNYPYSGYLYNFTLDKHSKNGCLNNISIEIRNDLICNPKGIKRISRILNDVLIELLNG